jgi:DNA-binding CsgD family transcriptional regulator
MTRTTTQATEATQAAILTILSTGEQLRQYEIARELGIHEHNDWSTRAVLEAMIRSELIEMERYNSINKDGSLSKLTYRHFRLTY